jgi:hypothetical protein
MFRYLVVLALAGCAGSNLQADRYEPTCARPCLAIQARCVANTAPLWRADCNENARQCLSTCPAR